MRGPGIRTAWLALTLLPASAAAQSLQPLSLQGLGVYVIRRAEGHDVRENDAHFGLEAQLRYTFSRVSIGVGFQRSTVRAGFIEPRYLVAAGTTTAVYLAGRVGLASLVCDAGVPCGDQGGELLLGGGGGVLLRLGDRLSLDLGAQYFTTSFTPDQTPPDRQRTGWIHTRLGLNVGL